MNSATRVEEETELAINVPESLELDEEYTKPSEIRWGRCTPFVMRDGIPRIVIGPHWPLFIFAFGFFAVASYFVISWHIHNENILIKVATVLVCVNQCISYAWVALVNPGVANQVNPGLTLPDESDSQGNQPRSAWYCKKCKIIQPIHTIHCYDCDVCVQEMDHHCPWTGKCIGKGNIKQFYYFIISTLVFMVYNIIMSLTQIEIKHK